MPKAGGYSTKQTTVDQCSHRKKNPIGKPRKRKFKFVVFAALETYSISTHLKITFLSPVHSMKHGFKR